MDAQVWEKQVLIVPEDAGQELTNKVQWMTFFNWKMTLQLITAIKYATVPLGWGEIIPEDRDGTTYTPVFKAFWKLKCTGLTLIFSKRINFTFRA